MDKSKAIMVHISGVPTRLIGAKKRPNGAVFYPLQPINIEFDGKNRPVSEEHISCWVNSSKKTVHIHRTVKTQDADFQKIETSLLAENPHGDFGAVILARAVPSRDARAPYVINPSKYEFLYIPAYSEKSATLLVCYAVTLAHQPLPDMSHVGIARVEIRLPQITIGLYYTYLSVPAWPYSIERAMGTTLLRINGKDLIPARARTMIRPVAQLADEISFHMAGVAQSHIDRMMRMFRDEQQSEDDINQIGLTINTIMPIPLLLNEGIGKADTLMGRYDIGMGWQRESEDPLPASL